MTRGQRTFHRYIWLVLALMIPILTFMALRDVPLGLDGDQPIPDSPPSGTSLVFEENWLRTAIVPKPEGNELHIWLKKPLRHASALVYTIDDKGEKDRVLGQLEGVGGYSFSIPQTIEGILLYDELKEVEIEKLVFEWD